MAIAHYTGLTEINRHIGYVGQPHLVCPDYQHFLTANNLTNTVTTRVLFGMYVDLRANAAAHVTFLANTVHFGGHDLNANAIPAVWWPAHPGGAAFEEVAVDSAINMEVNGITGTHLREIHYFMTHSSAWIAELATAHLHSDLNPENIVSYFRMVKINITNPRPIMLFLDFVSSEMIATWRHANSIALLNTTTWGRYRSSVSSVGQLYLMMRADYGGITDDILGAANIVLIDALLNEPHLIARHRAIPQITIAKIYAALEASGGVPNNWYSGVRAYGVVNNATKTAWRTGFRRILEVRNDLAGVGALNNLGQIIDATNLRHA